MGVKERGVGNRAWKLLRVWLVWARKGGALRRRMVMELPKYLKRLQLQGHANPPSHIPYFERELSFDETPVFHVKMHRPSSMRFHLPHIPCIRPHVVDFDCDRRQCPDMVPDQEDGIDKRAEEFIANFYHQMKLQRQISYLQYTETPNTGSP